MRRTVSRPRPSRCFRTESLERSEARAPSFAKAIRPTGGGRLRRRMASPSGSAIHRVESAGVLLLRISGTIDETFDRSQIEKASGVLVLDLDEVRRITSSGVREWVAGLTATQASYCCFVRCRPAVVAQFNM